MSYQNNTCAGVHEIYNYGRPFLGYLYYALSLSDLCQGGENMFKEIMHFRYICDLIYAHAQCPPSGS